MTTSSVIQAKPLFARRGILAIAGALKAMQYLEVLSLALLSRNLCGGLDNPDREKKTENKLFLKNNLHIFPRTQLLKGVSSGYRQSRPISNKYFSTRKIANSNGFK